MILSHLSGPIPNPAPRHAQLHAIKILHLNKFRSSRQITPQHCASAFSEFHLPGLFPVRLLNLYRDGTCTQQKLYLDGKKHAIPVLPPGPFFGESTRTGGRIVAPGNTTSLYCRAVRLHAALELKFLYL